MKCLRVSLFRASVQSGILALFFTSSSSVNGQVTPPFTYDGVYRRIDTVHVAEGSMRIDYLDSVQITPSRTVIMPVRQDGYSFGKPDLVTAQQRNVDVQSTMFFDANGQLYWENMLLNGFRIEVEYGPDGNPLEMRAVDEAGKQLLLRCWPYEEY